MFSLINGLAIVAVEIICCDIFFGIFTKPANRLRGMRKALLLGLLVVSDFLLAVLLASYFVPKELAVIACNCTIMKIINRDTWKKNLVLSVFFQGLILLMDYIVFSVIMTLYSSNIIEGDNYVIQGQLIVLLGKALLLISILITHRRFKRGIGGAMIDSEWIRFMIFPIFTIITITAMIQSFQQVQNQRQAMVLYVIAFGMVGMNLVVYNLIYDIVERETRLREKSMYEMQVKNQMEMYQSISDSFEKQKRNSHEFQNQLLCIEALASQEKFEHLKQYVREISGNFHQERNVIDTNHTIINTILNTKYAEAVSKRITFIFKVNDLSAVRISNQDLVILLSNLLNNAMEACEKCEEKRIIRVKFLLQDNETVLAVSNSTREKLKYEGQQIVTSKTSNPQEHGVGIHNILRIVEKYQGSYSIKEEDREFLFSILIQNRGL